MRDMWQQVSESVGSYLPSLAGALALLLLFWLGAVIASAIVRKVVKRYQLDVKVMRLIDPEARETQSGVWAGRVVFAIIMLFGLNAFFNALQLDAVTEPVNRMLGDVFAFAPRLLGALLILALAWLLASLVRLISSRGIAAARVDERLEKSGATGEGGTRGTLAASISSVLYWLVLLLFLPLMLDVLSLEGLLAPVQSMLDGFLGFMPNLFAAGLILLVGWFLARIVRQIVTGLLEASGVDRFGGSNESASKRMKISRIGGTLVYALILLPVIVASLDALALGAVAEPAKQMLATVLDALPNLLTASLILGLAYLVARLVSGLVADLLSRLGFDNLFAWLGIRRDPEEAGTRTPSQTVGTLVLVATLYLAAVEASRQLGLDVLTLLLRDFAVFAGQVLLGLVIFALGLYLSRLATNIIASTEGRHSGLLARVARASILVFSAAMALRQMGIAEDIVTTAFTLLLGAIAVAFAIAFGLGGRDAARGQLERLGRPRE